MLQFQGEAAEWKLMSDPLGYLVSVDCSADGQTIVAAEAIKGPIHVSTNAGSTWNSTGSPRTNWLSVACSADGTRIAGITGGEVARLFLSTNGGFNWEVTILPKAWRSTVLLSADGAKLVIAGGGPLLTSSDFGSTWTNYSAPEDLVHLDMSPDGKRFVAEAQGPASPIYLSANSGMTWFPTGVTNDYPGGVAMSADGTTLVAASYSFGLGGPIYTSIDGGSSWDMAELPNEFWDSVTCSADGTTLCAVGLHAYVSSDSGRTWELTDYYTGWVTELASSADGCRLIAAAQTKGIWIRETAPQPVVKIRPAGAEIILSWIIPSQPFILQESSALKADDWSDVPITPVLNYTNLHHEVRLLFPDSPRFYRLKAQ